MKLPGTETDFIIIGENVHTTRVLLKKGKRFWSDGAAEGVTYVTTGGEERVLPIPDSARKGQDYQQGRIKHVKLALDAAMNGSGAVAEEGQSYLRALVHAQEEAGAAFLDINVDEFSLKLAEQKAAMTWLVDAVQAMTQLPVAIDSSNSETIEVGLAAADQGRGQPMLNSASLERIDALDMALRYNAKVVVTAAGEKGMPNSVEERMDHACRIVDAALAKGLALGDLYVDPLIFPISVDSAFGLHCLDAIRQIRSAYGSEIHITGGMSNVSFGIPSRKIINDVFLILAVEAGADSGIVDPVASRLDGVFRVDRTTPSYKLAEDVLLGRDKDCRAYIKAWRKKELEPLHVAA